MDSPRDTRSVEAVVRALVTAGKSLRLYPAASPIPLQSIQAALEALADYFLSGDPVLVLTVTRAGLAFDSLPLPLTLGSDDLVDRLQDHGVAELAIMNGCSGDELLTFLGLLDQSPEDMRARGGLGVAMAGDGIERVRVADVQLTVVEHLAPGADENVDDFLRNLVSDPERLAAWFSAAAAGDPATFEEGLMELVRVSGPSGYESLLQSLSAAFLTQSSDGKDALLGLAMDAGPSRDLTGGVFCFMNSSDIAGSVLEGSFGRNMLSLSSALTRLPLEQVTAQVRAEVQAMLPSTGRSNKEAQFLDHMIEIRERATPEPALVDADRTYRAVAEAAALPADVIEKARNAVAGSSGGALSAAGVRTILTLLDQQRDFELYCATANNLAGLVPRLIEQGDVPMAARIITELSNREARESDRWPELPARMHDALSAAAGARSMGALVQAVSDDPALLPTAQLIVRHAGETGPPALTAEAIALKDDGVLIAEKLLGRRIIDELNTAAPQLQWFQLAPVSARLCAESDERSARTLDALMQRPDEQSRREVVTGAARAATGPLGKKVLAKGLADANAEVGIVSARALGRDPRPECADLLATRLGELDVNGADFPLAREVIAALAHRPEPVAGEALKKLASKRSLMKRGHFTEVHGLAQQALDVRAKETGAR